MSSIRGDIVLVRVRFSNDRGMKRRPAVIVSVDAVHDERADALIMPLTSRIGNPRYGDVVLQDWTAAGLPRESIFKGVVSTVDRSTFGQTIGQLSARDLLAVESSLRRVLGI